MRAASAKALKRLAVAVDSAGRGCLPKTWAHSGGFCRRAAGAKAFAIIFAPLTPSIKAWCIFEYVAKRPPGKPSIT